LYDTWKQRVVVDARPGAAGAISADLTMGSAADGYTWMMLTSQLFVASQVLADIKVRSATRLPLCSTDRRHAVRAAFEQPTAGEITEGAD